MTYSNWRLAIRCASFVNAISFAGVIGSVVMTYSGRAISLYTSFSVFTIFAVSGLARSYLKRTAPKI